MRQPLPEFPRARGVFITGTDTGVGKTAVAGALARVLASFGHAVGVFKPIATGCQLRREGLVSQDAEFLAHCSGTSSPLADIAPVRYAQPLTPAVAAEMARRPVDWDHLRQSYEWVTKAHDFTVVEGIGGVLAPLARGVLVADLMVALALPVVVAAPSRLGAISQALLSLEACRSRGLEVLGVVINGYRADGGEPAEETNPRVIAAYGRTRVLAIIPYDGGTCVENGLLGAEVLAAMRLTNWAEVLGL